MTHPVLISAVVGLATWDGWRWYIGRVAAEPEQVVSLALTAALIVGIGLLRGRRAAGAPLPLLLIAALLVAYAAACLLLPPIMRAALAIALTLFCAYASVFRDRPPVAFWGLVALALPVLPSLQFVLGYPLRVISAAATVALLQVQGLMVERQGTFLLWRGEMVQFDAPCSGVNMLWAGLLLTLAVCLAFRFNPARTAAALILSVALTLMANVLRASSLFYVEAGLIGGAPAWWHDGIGIAAFVLCGAVTLHLLQRLRDWRQVHA
jgi:exosortase/archaeosortase family protein